MATKESAQPQLPPRPELSDAQLLPVDVAAIDRLAKLDKITLASRLLRLEAENEYFKSALQAQTERASTQAYRNIVLSAEHDKMLEVIRKYRRIHPSCCIRIAGLVNETKLDGRCPTCIKADALLSKEETK